ncbi:hAT family dimerization protein, partial [Rhizoctonia solani AG-3 Rhs1AP]
MFKYHEDIYVKKCKAEGVPIKLPGYDNPNLETLRLDLDGPQPVFTWEGLLERLVRWIAVDDQSMNVVEQPEFRKLLLYCGQGALQNKDIPHQNKVTSKAHNAYLQAKAAIMHEIKNSQGQVSLTTDLWSDELLRAFMAVTAHYINSQGDLAEHLVAFRKIDGHHTGANVGQVLFSVIEEMGIIGHITSDNASNNNTMMDELKCVFDSRGIHFDPEESRLRCFPHIINIATQAYLHALPASAEKFQKECAEKGIQLSEAQSGYLDGLRSDAVSACQETAKACRSSGIRREGFMLQPILDCPTRWASTADMIDNFRLLYIFKAILDYSIRNTDLDIPCLTHRQFSILQDVSTVLAVPCRAQQLLSAERTPTLALALPLYENLINIWKTCLVKFPEQRHAICLGIAKIEEYVAKSRESPAHAFAMFVNPHIKMNWINANWTSPPGQITRMSPAERALEVIKARLLVYAEERHQRKLARCTQIQSAQMSSADRAAMSQQHGYAELLLLGETINRAPDHPLSSLFMDPIASTSSFDPNLAANVLPNPISSSPLSSNLLAEDLACSSSELQPLSYAALVAQLTPEQLRAQHLADIEAEVAIWLGTRVLPFETDPNNPLKKRNINIVDFWKDNGEVLPLIHRMAVDVLPAQASSVSSERVFSSSKLTCTRERNRISAELVEALQVVKHSVRRQRSSELDSQQLDFSERIVPTGDDVVE